MFKEYLLVTYCFILVCGMNNNNNTYKGEENCTYLQDDYDTLYNTSLSLYRECVSQLDNTINLYDNELMVTDMCMENLEKCETKTTNLTNFVNYTTQIKLLKDNIELESSMLVLKKKFVKLEEKNNVAYELISDYKEDIVNLKNNITDLTYELHGLDDKWQQCQMDVRNQTKNFKNLFSSLNACLEREELEQDLKNKYVIKLATCRKNKKKQKV